MTALADHQRTIASRRQRATRQDTAVLKPALKRLAEATNADSILLFGSRARGDHHKDSDFDLCVLVPETRPFAGRKPFWLWHLVRDLGLPIEIVMMETEDFERGRHVINSLAQAIDREGVAIYERCPASYAPDIRAHA